jgi:hypothetical protein
MVPYLEKPKFALEEGKGFQPMNHCKIVRRGCLNLHRKKCTIMYTPSISPNT